MLMKIMLYQAVNSIFGHSSLEFVFSINVFLCTGQDNILSPVTEAGSKEMTSTNLDIQSKSRLNFKFLKVSPCVCLMKTNTFYSGKCTENQS